MTIALYGIANCDTMKKARAWLDAEGLDHRFHDYKKQGVDAERLAAWVERAGWEKLLNRAGMTFRRLPDADKANLDAGRAIALMLAHPSAIKRPVLEADDRLLIGFSPDAYAGLRS